MKKVFTLLVGLMLLFPIQFVFADQVDTKTGNWESDGHRSVVASPPILNIEGKILTVTFVDPLEDLTVRIFDVKGVPVYEEVLSGMASETYPISLENEGKGEYQVVLTHQLGWLYGTFWLE